MTEEAAQKQALLEEEFRLRRLQRAVDRLSREILHGMPDERFEERYAEVRELAQHLFPDKLELFDRIYGARFQRLREQFKKGI
jgi:hypothetical protein